VETHLTGKIGTKKLRKLEEKQARKAQREASRRDGDLGGAEGPSLPYCKVSALGVLLAGLVAAACLSQSHAGLVCALGPDIAFPILSGKLADHLGVGDLPL
jgi:hypothetical protein